MGIALNLKTIRKSLNLSQEEVAAKVGYKNASKIAEIENGNGDPSFEKIKDIANALGVSIYQLKGNNKKRETNGDPIFYSEADLIALDLFSPILKVLDDAETEQLLDFALALTRAKDEKPRWKEPKFKKE